MDNDYYSNTTYEIPQTAIQDDSAFNTFGGLLMCFYLIIVIVGIYAYYKIITKAGYPGWYLLLYFIPLLNIVLFFLFAFSKWPIEQRVEELEERLFKAKKETKASSKK